MVFAPVCMVLATRSRVLTTNNQGNSTEIEGVATVILVNAVLIGTAASASLDALDYSSVYELNKRGTE
jgi:hypothetical protein